MEKLEEKKLSNPVVEAITHVGPKLGKIDQIQWLSMCE